MNICYIELRELIAKQLSNTTTVRVQQILVHAPGVCWRAGQASGRARGPSRNVSPTRAPPESAARPRRVGRASRSARSWAGEARRWGSGLCSTARRSRSAAAGQRQRTAEGFEGSADEGCGAKRGALRGHCRGLLIVSRRLSPEKWARSPLQAVGKLGWAFDDVGVEEKFRIKCQVQI